MMKPNGHKSLAVPRPMAVPTPPVIGLRHPTQRYEQSVPEKLRPFAYFQVVIPEQVYGWMGRHPDPRTAYASEAMLAFVEAIVLRTLPMRGNVLVVVENVATAWKLDGLLRLHGADSAVSLHSVLHTGLNPNPKLDRESWLAEGEKVVVVPLRSRDDDMLEHPGIGTILFAMGGQAPETFQQRITQARNPEKHDGVIVVLDLHDEGISRTPWLRRLDDASAMMPFKANVCSFDSLQTLLSQCN
ncbi:MAG TPA: hypothetical protein V6D00_08405 [Pantanalinema sp.]